MNAFEIQGRRGKFTPTSQLLYRCARAPMEEAVQLEQVAKKLSAARSYI